MDSWPARAEHLRCRPNSSANAVADALPERASDASAYRCANAVTDARSERAPNASANSAANNKTDIAAHGTTHALTDSEPDCVSVSKPDVGALPIL